MLFHLLLQEMHQMQTESEFPNQRTLFPNKCPYEVMQHDLTGIFHHFFLNDMDPLSGSLCLRQGLADRQDSWVRHFGM